MVSGPFATVRAEMSQLLAGFTAHFGSKHYTEVTAVDISSRVDKSVDLIGSHISVLKRYLDEESVPATGLNIIQPCIRTHGLSLLLDDDKQPPWGTFFRNLGVLIHPSRAEDALWDGLAYLHDCVGLSKDLLTIRVSTQDPDLHAFARIQEAEGFRVECDGMPISYYRHTLGMDRVSGRNFNYAVERDGQFFDLGNFIIIERDGRPIGIEIGLGNTSLLKAKLDLDHVCLAEPLEVDCSEVPEVKPKLFDAVIAATHLLSEGVKPSSIKSCNRTLRTLLKGVSHLANKAQIDALEITSAVKDYERHYGMGALASSSMTEHLKSYGLGETIKPL